MKKILIVVDMQKDFIDGALGTVEAVQIVPYVAQKLTDALAKGDKVYFTQDTHQEDYLETTEGTALPVKHCVKGSEGWQVAQTLKAILEGYKEGEAYHCIEKPVFGSTTLVKVLEDVIDDETCIEMVGLCTDICVVANAMLLKTFYPDTPLIVDAKGCAGVTKETHQAALTKIGRAHV